MVEKALFAIFAALLLLITVRIFPNRTKRARVRARASRSTRRISNLRLDRTTGVYYPVD